MQQAYRHLIRAALNAGHTVSVWDGEEWQVKRGTTFQALVDAVQSVEEAQLRIRDAEGNIVGWALVSAFGLEPDETVMDNTITPFMEAWEAAYDAATA